MNSVILIGRLTKDVEVKQTTTGKNVTSFTLAVDRWKKGETDFIPCVAWGTTADVTAQYTHKGDMLGVSGRLKATQYETSDGQKRTRYEVEVGEVQFIQPKKQDDAWIDAPIDGADLF